jgi:hypothetical protein
VLLALFILGVILIGWFTPAFVVRRMPSGLGFAFGCIAALTLGAGFIWLGAEAAEAFGIEESRSAFDRGFNAWKIMLLIAPASALHTRRKTTAGDS